MTKLVPEKVKQNITPILSTVSIASWLATLAIIFTFWSDYGWVTIPVYASIHPEGQHVSIAPMLKTISDELMDLNKKVDKNRSEQICKDIDEEMPELKALEFEAITSGDGNPAELTYEIKKLADIWSRLDCAQFSDIIYRSVPLDVGP